LTSWIIVKRDHTEGHLVNYKNAKICTTKWQTIMNMGKGTTTINAKAELIIINGSILPLIVCSIAFSPSNELLAFGNGNGTVHIWNGSNGSCTQLEGHTAGIKDLAFSPCGSLLSTASTDNMVRLWTLADSSCRILEGHGHTVNAIAFSPDGLSLTSGSFDGSTRLWNVGDGSCTSILRDESLHEVYSVAFSPDGKTLVSAGGNEDEETGRIIIWSVSDDGNWSPAIIISEQVGAVYSIVYSPNGRYLASGGDDHSVRLWNTCDGGLKYVFEGHTDYVSSLCFSPNGNIIASGSFDQSVRLWNVSDGTNLLALQNHHEGIIYAIAFSPDGRTLASASTSDHRSVQLWNPYEAKKTNWDEVCRLWSTSRS
jgi:WD40 repeat protein